MKVTEGGSAASEGRICSPISKGACLPYCTLSVAVGSKLLITSGIICAVLRDSKDAAAGVAGAAKALGTVQT